VTQEWVAPGTDDPALDALEDALGPARALGLDTQPAEAILLEARRRLGTRADAAQKARIALTSLADAAGLKTTGVRDLISDPARRRAVDGAISELALLMDMEGFERKALTVVRRRARARGLGPLRMIQALRERRARRTRATGAAASPEDHLLAWQERGDVARAGDHVRSAIDDALPSIPGRLRLRYAAAGRGGDLEARLRAGVERVVVESAPEAGIPPSSYAWRLAGVLQWLNFAILVITIVSIVGGAAGVVPEWRTGVAAGLAEAPLVLCPLIAFALAAWLHINVEKLGRIWASRIENDIRRGIRVVVEAEAFATLAPIESARAKLGEAWHQILVA
jgi:hypothetical protein